ncbi:hypothetical protein Taro_005860 [Colocasia esculenta]|uniref:Uncharacterized protein n=1 Tax=Colocasia esculenta TaxID=4460 RepID=A0A843TM42_COLES|nr:hypothetical protein [Colocasia esculenta]
MGTTPLVRRSDQPRELCKRLIRHCPNHRFPLSSRARLRGCQLEHTRSPEYSLNRLLRTGVPGDSHLVAFTRHRQSRTDTKDARHVCQTASGATRLEGDIGHVAFKKVTYPMAPSIKPEGQTGVPGALCLGTSPKREIHYTAREGSMLIMLESH